MTTMRAMAEVGVHFGQFCNVDLFHIGLYQVRCRMFPEDAIDAAALAALCADPTDLPACSSPSLSPAGSAARSLSAGGSSTGAGAPRLPVVGACAVPHLSSATQATASPSRASRTAAASAASGPAAPSAAALRRRALLPGPAVIVEEASFRTSTFLVRYCEEEVMLNELAQFRFERDASDTSPMLLQVRLMFADLAKYGGIERFDGPASKYVPEEDLEFEEVSTVMLRLHSPLQGLHAYCPVVFDEAHFCQVDLMVHASVLDFRLRLRPGAPAPTSTGGSMLVCGGTVGCVPGARGRSGSHGDEEEESLSLRPALAACSLRRASDFDACIARNGSKSDGGSGGGGSGLSNKALTAPLEEAMLGLARRTKAHADFFAGATPRAENSCGLLSAREGQRVKRHDDVIGLGDAVDIVQKEYVGRLAATYSRLADQLAELEPKPSSPVNRRGRARPMVLPGTAGAEGALGDIAGGGRARVEDGLAETSPGPPPVPLSYRLADACERPGQAHASAGATAARLLAEDLSFASSQVRNLWQELISFAAGFPANSAQRLRGAWDRQLRRHWAQSVFRTVLPSSTAITPEDQQVWELHARLASALRRSQKYRGRLPHTIEDLSLSYSAGGVHSVLFDQRYADGHSANLNDAHGAVDDGDEEHLQGYIRSGPPPPLRASFQRASSPERSTGAAPSADGPSASSSSSSKPTPYKGMHVFVLVHGFQGQAFDMRLVKNNIALLFPRALYLNSSANERDTDADIGVMGANLAKEVVDFIKEWCPGGQKESLGRLSFICHSNGGLVARSSLPHLIQEFGDKFYTYVSFSSPHLGYLYPSSDLFKTGLWVLRQMKRSACLDQLTLSDAPDAKDSFVSRLAQAPGLELFQHVVLVSSFQDQYAPFESARIEMSACVEQDAKTGQVYSAMVHNLLGKIRPERLLRVDVDFHIPETSLDTMIGRTAHLQFIENQPLLRMFIHSYRWLFE